MMQNLILRNSIYVGCMGVAGYALGKLTSTNPKLMAVTWAVTAVARQIMLYTFFFSCGKQLKTKKALYIADFSLTIGACVAGSLAMQKLGLIRTASEVALRTVTLYCCSVGIIFLACKILPLNRPQQNQGANG